MCQPIYAQRETKLRHGCHEYFIPKYSEHSKMLICSQARKCIESCLLNRKESARQSCISETANHRITSNKSASLLVFWQIAVVRPRRNHSYSSRSNCESLPCAAHLLHGVYTHKHIGCRHTHRMHLTCFSRLRGPFIRQGSITLLASTYADDYT